jgi:hypothetical protein
MYRSARSVLVYGIYLCLLGLVFVAVPGTLLGLLRLPGATDVWVRMLGIALVAVSFLYIQAARQELLPFFEWSVVHRMAMPLGVALFVWLGWARLPLLVFGVVDAASAVWTRLMLPRDLRY